MSDLFDYKKEMSELRFTEIQKKALAEAAASAAGTTAGAAFIRTCLYRVDKGFRCLRQLCGQYFCLFCRNRDGYGSLCLFDGIIHCFKLRGRNKSYSLRH